MSDERERDVTLVGAHNVRDLGGLPAAGGVVARGLLFRGDVPTGLPAQDLAVLRDELGLRVLVDLRTTLEHRGAPPVSLGPDAVVHHVPLFDAPTDPASQAEARSLPLAHKYALLLQVAAEPIAEAVRVVAASTQPVMVFCSAGKDRTGLLSAVLLSLLGVPRDDIVADYARTRAHLEPVLARLSTLRGVDAMLAHLRPEDLDAAPETMASLLDIVHEGFGGMAGYAREIGVSDAVVTTLRGRLIA